MNKYLFFLGMTGMTLLSACDSNELEVDSLSLIPSENESSLVIAACKDSDIPITFGELGNNSNAITRSPIELDENHLFVTTNGKYLGVFCLATGKQEGAPSFIGDIEWNDPNKIANWKENVPAKVTNDGLTCEVKFLDPDNLPTETSKEWYYPLGNWYHYNFYAYYPRITDVNAIHVGSNSVIVDYEIDGRQDIIGGQTTPPSQGFCARYFRENASAEEPQFTFNHKLAQLKFKIHSENGVTIESLALKDVCYKLSLVVAGSTSNHETGELYVNDSSVKKDIQIWTSDDKNPFDTDGDEITTPITVSAESEVEIGYMLVPSAADYSVAVKIEGVDDPKNVNVGPVVAGHKYTFTLNIN